MPIRSAHALAWTTVFAALAGASLVAYATNEHTVSQKGKAFTVKKLKIKVGDAIKFVNDDSFSHNVFSLSSTKSFDLGTYPQGGARSVTFDKAGTVEIECAIHPDMTMTVEVVK